jgi:hypothetical protein
MSGPEAGQPGPDDLTVSRRRILKRVGIGAAAVWTAPLLFSASPASAHSSGGALCAKLAASKGLAACTPCPACNNRCGSGPVGCGCACFVDIDGCCLCGEDFLCPGRVCLSHADCPPGTKCSFTCCPGDRGLRCVSRCGAGPVVATAATSGLTAGGAS